jgi:hypothetical protein
MLNSIFLLGRSYDILRKCDLRFGGVSWDHASTQSTGDTSTYFIVIKVRNQLGGIGKVFWVLKNIMVLLFEIHKGN